MIDTTQRIVPGLLDSVTFPQSLQAHVVEPRSPTNDEARIHGYAVASELAPQADFVGVIWLTLTTQWPNALQREALSWALTLLSPLDVGQAPTHACVLAKIAGSSQEHVPAVGVLALAHFGTEEIRRYAAIIADRPPAEWPAAAFVDEPRANERAAYLHLCQASQRWFGAHALPAAHVLKADAAAYAIFSRLGLRDPLSLQSLAMLARLPVILAEAAHTVSGSVLRYPTTTPTYNYVEEIYGCD